MECIVQTQALAAALKTILPVIQSRPVLPILNGVLLEAQNDTLRLTATDLDVSVATEVNAEVTGIGACVLSARHLNAIATRAMGDAIRFAEAATSSIRVSCESSTFCLASMNPADFPKVKNDPFFGSSLLVPAESFGTSLRRVAFAASSDSTRFVLNGTLLRVSGGGELTLAATDGRRLALCEVKPEDPSVKPVAADYILPQKATSILLKALAGQKDGDVSIFTDCEDRIGFSIGDGAVRISTVLVQGAYPDYQRILDSQNEERGVLTTPRKALLEKLDLVLVAVDKGDSAAVKLSVGNGAVSLSATGDEFGSADDQVDCLFSGTSIEISINGLYLQECLANQPDENAVIRVAGDREPVKIECESARFRCLIMPLHR